MHRALLVVVALSACGPKPDAAPPAANNTAPADAPAGPVGALPVDLVTVELTAVVIWRADARGVTELHRVELPDAVDGLVWRTPDELFVSTLGGQVLAISGGTSTPVALPPPAAWALPDPEPGGELEPVAMEQLYADADGAVWLGRCQWGDTYDGGHCAAWSYARIAPGAAEMVATPAAPRPQLAWIKPAPSGHAATLETFQPQPDPELDEGPREPVERVRCTSPDGAAAIPDDDGASDPDFYGAELGPWVAHDPPMLLVARLEPGLGDDVPAWRLHRACDAAPLADVMEHALGPAGVWAYTSGEGGWRVMLDGKELAVLPDNQLSVTFAPPRP